MQANNKSDAAQVYEGATRATKLGIKDSIKYILKPLTIFSYHYFLEGIKAVQKDGPTKELEKITNLSYEETIRVMERCQKDGIRVVASERNLNSKNSEFGKNKSLYEQMRITKDARRIKQLSNFKEKYPKLAKKLFINNLILKHQKIYESKVAQHKDKVFNIYFNKSKVPYLTNCLEDIIEYRTGISEKLFNDNTQEAIKEIITDKGMTLNSQQLETLSNKFMLHELGSAEVQDFKQDYTIHELPFSSFLAMQDELEATEIPYGIDVIKNSDDEQIANVYFENKHLQRYSELGFNYIGKINVYGTETKNMEWAVNSQEDLVTFTTKTGEEEIKTYETLKGKNYIMKREGNECLWTVLKENLKEISEEEKKRDVVKEEINKVNDLKNIDEKEIENGEINITEDLKELNFDFEKEIDK